METTDAKKRREERELADRTRLDEFIPDAARPAEEAPKAPPGYPWPHLPNPVESGTQADLRPRQWSSACATDCHTNGTCSHPAPARLAASIPAAAVQELADEWARISKIHEHHESPPISGYGQGECDTEQRLYEEHAYDLRALIAAHAPSTPEAGGCHGLRAGVEALAEKWERSDDRGWISNQAAELRDLLDPTEATP